MAFADPQSVTIGTTPGTVTLPRTGMGPSSGSFSSADGLTDLTISQQYGKRTRRTVRLDFQKTAADPLVTGNNTVYSASCYVVLDVPTSGFSAAEQKDLVVALANYLTASTNANTTKLVGGEA